jgi:hypothetical protein
MGIDLPELFKVSILSFIQIFTHNKVYKVLPDFRLHNGDFPNAENTTCNARKYETSSESTKM